MPVLMALKEANLRDLRAGKSVKARDSRWFNNKCYWDC